MRGEGGDGGRGRKKLSGVVWRGVKRGGIWEGGVGEVVMSRGQGWRGE